MWQYVFFYSKNKNRKWYADSIFQHRLVFQLEAVFFTHKKRHYCLEVDYAILLHTELELKREQIWFRSIYFKYEKKDKRLKLKNHAKNFCGWYIARNTEIFFFSSKISQNSEWFRKYNAQKVISFMVFVTFYGQKHIGKKHLKNKQTQTRLLMINHTEISIWNFESVWD